MHNTEVKYIPEYTENGRLKGMRLQVTTKDVVSGMVETIQSTPVPECDDIPCQLRRLKYALRWESAPPRCFPSADIANRGWELKIRSHLYEEFVKLRGGRYGMGHWYEPEGFDTECYG